MRDIIGIETNKCQISFKFSFTVLLYTVYFIFLELQESSEREQDDIISSPYTCGGFKKKDIEF
jgi:hypothetical protein